MPYRVWHYACSKFVATPLFGCLLIGMLPTGMAGFVVSCVAGVILGCLCLTGAVMGALMVFGKLRMRCPFCGQSGEAWGSKSEGLRMECPECGLIWSGGRLGLEIFRERP